ncbi:10027_t:CDS:2, partial [Entrophospora sp. SA101]
NELEDLKKQIVVVYNPSTSSGISEENNKNKSQFTLAQDTFKFILAPSKDWDLLTNLWQCRGPGTSLGFGFIIDNSISKR